MSRGGYVFFLFVYGTICGCFFGNIAPYLSHIIKRDYLTSLDFSQAFFLDVYIVFIMCLLSSFHILYDGFGRENRLRYKDNIKKFWYCLKKTPGRTYIKFGKFCVRTRYNLTHTWPAWLLSESFTWVWIRVVAPILSYPITFFKFWLGGGTLVLIWVPLVFFTFRYEERLEEIMIKGHIIWEEETAKIRPWNETPLYNFSIQEDKSFFKFHTQDLCPTLQTVVIAFLPPICFCLDILVTLLSYRHIIRCMIAVSLNAFIHTISWYGVMLYFWTVRDWTVSWDEWRKDPDMQWLYSNAPEEPLWVVCYDYITNLLV